MRLEPEQIGESRTIQLPEGVALNTGDRLSVGLRTFDHCGNFSEMTGQTAIYDDTAPPVTAIVDSGDYINPNYDALKFSLESSVVDNESGIASVEYQLLTGGESLVTEEWVEYVNFQAVSPEIEITDTLPDGRSAILALRITNNAGLESFSFSNGIIIDTSKPYIGRVVVNEGRECIDSYDISAIASSFDETSTITGIEYVRGEFIDGEWTEMGDAVSLTGDVESFFISLDEEDIDLDKKIWYAFTVTDSAGNTSLPYYSQGMLYNPALAEIQGLSGEYSNGTLRMTWTTADSMLQPDHFSVNLLYDGEEIENTTLSGSEVSWESPVSGEGTYQFEITGYYEDLSSTAVTSVTVDTSAPLVSNLRVTPYVSDSIGFECLFSDTASYVNEWKYRIGKIGEVGVVSGGWVASSEVLNVVDETLLFDELEGGDSVKHKDNLVVEIAARDRFGNWSREATSDWSLVDLSAPEEVAVDIAESTMDFDGGLITCTNRYLTRSTAVDDVSIAAQDGESGILGYRWYVGEVADGGEGSALSDPVYVPLETVTSIMQEESLSFKVQGLEDGKKYKAYISLRNQAGVDTEWFETPLVMADFSEPEITLSVRADDQVGFDIEYQRPVINGNAELEAAAEDSLSEAIILSVRVYDPSSTLVSEEEWMVNETSGNTVLDFHPTLENYGVYLIEADGRDAAGNSTAEPAVIAIRYNAPPQMSLPEVIEVNPGRPFILKGSEYDLYDQDGLGKIVYTIRGDGYESVLGPASVGADIETSLLHSATDPRAPLTEYNLECEVEDEFGQSAGYVTDIHVVNTREGRLYVNEFWSGTHYLNGKVTVPGGLILTLLNETEVLCKGGVNGSENQPAELAIETAAELVHDGDASYKLRDSSLGLLWNGIYLEGKGNFNGITIQGAGRGLVVTETADPAEIDNCIFRDNNIGLHMFRDGVLINNCEFSGNTHYGIKEEESSDPQVIGSVFAGNGYDYYDSDMTVIDDIEILNDLDGNSDNTERD